MSERIGVVVCPQPHAAEEGGRTLQLGGTAIDAAVAAAFVQMVVDPPMAGVAGFGGLLYYEAARRRFHALDFSGRAGQRSHAGQWAAELLGDTADRFGYRVRGRRNDVGYESIGTPGVVDGLGVAHQKWGRLAWKNLFARSIELAANGFETTRPIHEYWGGPSTPDRAGGLERAQQSAAGEELFLRDGRPPAIGEPFVQEALARTINAIAEGGPRELYEGETARRMAREFDAHGGHVTLSDLHSYSCNWVEPVVTSYRSRRLVGLPPPMGGLLVAQALQVIEQFDLSLLGHNTADSIRVVSEALKYAIADRVRLGSDPDFSDIPLDVLLDKERATRTAKRIQSSPGSPVPVSNALADGGTTHVTVIDLDGNVASLTHSIGFSAGVISTELGVLYNNYMVGFDPRPNQVDSIAPGKRRGTRMAPTIVMDDAEVPQLVLGAPGATRITSAIVQAMLNVLDYGFSPIEAVSLPRFDCQGQAIEAERRIPEWVVAELRERAYTVVHRPQNYDEYFARVQLCLRTPQGWRAAADPRRDGASPVYVCTNQRHIAGGGVLRLATELETAG
jgi:gamma-glutamyltranspeptidase / glutathione hydrolase